VHGSLCCSVNVKLQLRSEASRTKHPERVITEGDFGRSRRTDALCQEIFDTGSHIFELKLRQAQRERIDSEIPPHKVVVQ
jgi:hypothetical protein